MAHRKKTLVVALALTFAATAQAGNLDSTAPPTDPEARRGLRGARRRPRRHRLHPGPDHGRHADGG